MGLGYLKSGTTLLVVQDGLQSHATYSRLSSWDSPENAAGNTSHSMWLSPTSWTS